MDITVEKAPEQQAKLFGHEEAEKNILDLWNKGTLAGSWLITGSKGVGKATFAYRVARFVLAQESDEKGLFGNETPSSLYLAEADHIFKAVALRTHPDLKVIERSLKEEEIKSRQALLEAGKTLDPETEKERKRFDEIRVSDIREAGDFLRRTSAVGGWRIVIIDSADEMNVNAANALLKSLEEPPNQTLLLLISHNPGRLLPTIRSRCRKIPLKPLKKDILENFLQENRPHLAPEEYHSTALLAEGSPGLGLSLIDEGGVALFKKLLELFYAFPAFEVPQLYEFAEKTLKDKEKMKMAQDMLLRWLNRLSIALSQAKEIEEIVPHEKMILQKFAAHLNPLELMDISDEIKGMFLDIDLDQKQAFVNACLKLQRKGG